MPIQKVIPNARALRFVRSNSKDINSDGTIKEDPGYVARNPEGSADFYASVLERYKIAQAEDADDPEMWVVFSPEEIAFGPEGSEPRKKYRVEDRQFRSEFLDKLDPYLMNHEMTLQQQFYRDYKNIVEGCKLAETVWGYNYSKREYENRWGKSAVITNREQLLKDIRNGETFSIETILQEKPGLWQSWNSKRYYTQNAAKEIKVYDARRAFLNNYFNGSVPDNLSEAKEYLSSRKVKLSILPINQKLLDSLLDNCLAGQNLSYVGEDVKIELKNIDAVKYF